MTFQRLKSSTCDQALLIILITYDFLASTLVYLPVQTLMRAIALLLVMMLSGCALPPGESLLTPATSNKPTPQATVIEVSNKIKALCLEPAYAAYFAKTFCTPSELSLAMMSDRTKINQAQKEALNAWSQAYDKLADEFNEVLPLTSAANKQMAEYNKIVAFPAAQKNRLDLYQRNITWAVYNRKRKDISDGIAAESRRVAQQKF
jgi:hypothetical protein